MINANTYFIIMIIVFIITYIIGIISVAIHTNNFKEVGSDSIGILLLTIGMGVLWPLFLIFIITVSLVYLYKLIVRRFKHDR